ncbi:trehalose-phosphatase [Salinimicrobium sp. CDJ15-81-2]|nr:trehalose-phosphatase [Salinimicrobium nanhaiense]
MIITLTANPALDIYSTTEKFEPNEKLRCEKPIIDPGGGGINVSRVIKRLGGESTAVYTRGGHTGKLFSDLLKKEGVKEDPVDVKNDLRQNFAITETSTGNLYRFGFPGAELEQDEYEALLKKVDTCEKGTFLVASGSLPPGAPADFYARAAERANKCGLNFVLDTSGKSYKGVLEQGVYLLKPNKKELKDITGEAAEDLEQQKKLLLKILEQYPVKIIVLSLGAEGALLATDQQVKHFPAPQVEHVSSIGAGDSMVAGMVYSLSLGHPVEEAVLLGLACGSATIKSPGTELLKKKDVAFLLEQLLQVISGPNPKQERDPGDLPSALENFTEIREKFSRHKPMLFLDFDGTLAPIVEHHADAAISEEMKALVKDLAKVYPVAVISGRGLADVKQRVDLPGLYYAGSHGYEISGPDGFFKENEEAQQVLPLFDELEPILKEELKNVEGVDFERKKFTLAVHYRQVKQEQEQKVHQVVNRILKQFPRLTGAGGKKVIEIRPDIDWHKGKAVEFLKRELSDEKDPFSIYVGDDVTDEDAFREVQHGLGILVGEHSQKTYADYSLQDIEEVKILFNRLLNM